MIRTSEIDATAVTAAGCLVGMRQPTLSGYNILDSAMYTSLSGLYFDDISGLLTVKNIKAAQEDPAISSANLNTFLKNRLKASFQTLLRSVFSENDLIENAVLYPYENDWLNTLTNDVSFVGYEIDPAKVKQLGIVINKIMLEFSATRSENVKVLCFHSSQNALQKSETITTLPASAKHTAVGWELPAFNSVSGGKWYIGYLRGGLAVKACNRNYHDANVTHRFRSLDIRPVKVAGWNDETLFDVNNIEYTDESYGMNFDISAYKDMTSYVVENKNRFARGLQLQVAADLLGLLATSIRSNQDERYIKAEALYELNGNRLNPEIPQSVGVLKQLTDEIKKIKGLFEQPKIQVNTLR